MLLKRMKFYIKFFLNHEFRDTVYCRQAQGTITFVSGENNLPKVLVIKRRNRHVGTFSDFIVFLSAVEIAVRSGYIPVINRKEIKNDFLPAADEINTWDLFFEQPMGVTLEELDKGKYQIFEFYADTCFPIQIINCRDSNVSEYWMNIAKKYLRIKSDLMADFERTKIELFGNKRILGVAIREGYNKLSDMNDKVNYGHPRQADAELMISLADEYLKKWDCERVYFTCQTIDTVKAFKDYFRDKAVCVSRIRPSYNELLEGKGLKKKRFEEAFINEKTYIEEMYLLSQCNCLLCTQNSGVDAAILMSSGYENITCLDLGKYS